MKAVILGSTGLIGSSLLKLLISSTEYTHITSFVRKKSDIIPSKLKEINTDFSDLSKYKTEFECDSVFITLGTTIKKAGSPEKFREVDYTFVLEAGKLAKESNSKALLMVTSMGADPNSSVFYSRVKGEIERDTKSLGLNSLLIFQPSLLLGNRNEFRLGEKIGEFVGNLFSFAFVGGLEKYKPISADVVAESMFKLSLSPPSGTKILESDEIEASVKKL